MPIGMDVVAVQQPDTDDLAAVLVAIDNAAMDVSRGSPAGGEHLGNGIPGGFSPSCRT